MNVLNEMSDEEFVPFLHSLGVDTYKKSFEWMLSDPDFAGVLRWLCDNLDHNNALSAREEYRYVEIQKKENLSPEELDTAVASIIDEHPGICLPGDQNAIEDLKLEINMLKERTHMLEKQEAMIKDLVRQNVLTKEELSLQLTKLNAAHQQSMEDEKSAADMCTSLAQEVETTTEDVIDVIANNLEVYANCNKDKDMAKQFLSFCPLDSYRQSQAIFRSQYDLYITKNLSGRQNDFTDDVLQTVLIEAKSLEERLTNAMCAYIESKAELSGEQAKLELVNNYKNVHPSQISACLIEEQSAVELLEQEECILEQQMQSTIEQFVSGRTNYAVETTAKAALAVRQQILSSISHLVDVSQRALSLDRVVYAALRRELRTVEEFVQFAAQLRQYAIAESEAVASRIESMNNICTEQRMCENKLHSSDMLLKTLYSILGAEPSDSLLLVKLYNDLQNNIMELNESISEGNRNKEISLMDFNLSTKPLSEYIYDGCTRQPNCRERGAAALAHALRQRLRGADHAVLHNSSLFSAVKNGDKQNLRKLWQWFLTDPPRLMAAMKSSRI